MDELPAEGYLGEFPALPTTWRTERAVTKVDEDGNSYPAIATVTIRYLKATRDWYETWARSPMATRFTTTDWTRLRQLAPLVDQYERRPAKDLASELRLQESLLGATVADRARLRLKLGTVEEASPAREPAEVHQLRAV
jgi:hypothetical protein